LTVGGSQRGAPERHASAHLSRSASRAPARARRGRTLPANTETGAASVYTEIAFAPFILVMMFTGSPPTDARLVDISHFAAAVYRERQDTQLTLPVLRLHGHYPGTYL
jgi:hypothetical protein